MKDKVLSQATIRIGDIPVRDLFVKPGQYVTVYLHTSDVERERRVYAIECHVDHEGNARVVLEDQSIVFSYQAVYGCNDKSVTIIVDGTPHEVEKEKISYAEVVTLAYQHPEIPYSVTYKRGPNVNHEGILAQGGTVMVKKDMVFNVSRTGQS